MAISLVQSKSGVPVTASVSFTSNTTAGNFLVFGFTDTGGVTATSAAKLGGSAGNFAKMREFSGSPASTATLASIWVDPNCAGGQSNITWTNTGALTSPTYWIAEFSGMPSSVTPEDTGTTASGAAGSWSASASSTQAIELWIGVVAIVSGVGAGGAGNGWTFVNVVDPNSDTCVYGWQTKSSTGTATFSGTGAGTKGWGAALTLLKGGSSFIADPNPGPNQAVMRSAVW